MECRTLVGLFAIAVRFGLASGRSSKRVFVFAMLVLPVRSCALLDEVAVAEEDAAALFSRPRARSAPFEPPEAVDEEGRTGAVFAAAGLRAADEAEVPALLLMVSPALMTDLPACIDEDAALAEAAAMDLGAVTGPALRSSSIFFARLPVNEGFGRGLGEESEDEELEEEPMTIGPASLRISRFRIPCAPRTPCFFVGLAVCVVFGVTGLGVDDVAADVAPAVDFTGDVFRSAPWPAMAEVAPAAVVPTRSSFRSRRSSVTSVKDPAP